MAWNDAINLPYARSRERVEGERRLLRIVDDVMAMECEELAPDAVAHPKPLKAVVKDGVQETAPSWRYRVSEHAIPFSALLQRGDRIPHITEIEVLDLVGRITQSAKDELQSDKDDNLSDWRIAAYEITTGIGKKVRMRVYDPGYASKVVEWQGRRANAVDPDAIGMAPAKQTSTLRELPGFTLRIAWVDVARQEEPRKGALGKYLETGYYPPAYQKQRDEALRLVKARLAKLGGSLADLAPHLVDEVIALANAGTKEERIAALLDLSIELVRRVITAKRQTPDRDRDRDRDPVPAPPKKPRAPRKQKAIEIETPPAGDPAIEIETPPAGDPAAS